MVIRFAEKSDLLTVNRLRKQVNELHVEGRPDIFKPGFPSELENYLYTVWEDSQKDVVVADEDGRILGFAILNSVHRPENPYMRQRDFLDVDEICVEASARRQGVGRGMIDFIRQLARDRGFQRVELNLWEFNRDALAFYEEIGFTTYRLYMELPV